ncbi:sensor histidine kinase [Sphingomonas aracearum]|uniref:sensor histidine kinase n=1 Tax=Sphingomonas aracearum TaxID=2283317 RepID=UPI0015F10CD6|nr:PAS domain-containing sensor histidine kinase [Sphingomonas aracearum]
MTDTLAFLSGDGAMARAIRDHDWQRTSLGRIENWSASLRTSVSLILNSHFPQCIVWGPDLVSIPNDAFLPILGSKPPALGRSFADVWAEAWDDLAPIAELAFAGEATFIENYPVRTTRFGEEEEAFFTFCYSPIRDEAGTVVGMLDTVVETTATIRADRELQVANRELGHRLKNTLAVTQAVTLQSIRRAANLTEAREAVSERLAALGRATDVLTGTSWDAADLSMLAGAALAAQGDDRYSLDGPLVQLASAQAISLSLALHELATNATKYGALSNDTGKVSLQWRLEVDPNRPGTRLLIQWTETGGPRVSQPQRQGFGSVLIERTLRSSFKGITVLDFRPEGLVFTLDAPWSGTPGAGTAQ